MNLCSEVVNAHILNSVIGLKLLGEIPDEEIKTPR